MVDEQIIAGLRRRDKGAFEYFWNNYYHRIYPICAFILGNGPDATDMTVDIMIDFVEKHADKLSTPRALFAFLRQMAVRRSIRLRDKRDRITCIERDSQVGAEDESSPEQDAEINQLMPLLSACLEHMTPKTQATLRMKYSNKISNEEIGRAVGGSKSYIGRVLNNARESLRKCIEKKAAEAAATLASEGKSWQPSLKPVFNLQTIESLLAKRPRVTEGNCPAFDKLAAASENIHDETLRVWSEAHLASCAECRCASLMIQSLPAAPNSAMEASGVVSSFHPRTLVKKIFPLAAAASIAAGVSIALMMNRTPRISPPSSADLVVKGAGDAMHAGVQRGQTKFTLHPLDKLVTGDKLGLFYSAEMDGYLAIFSLDDKGEIALIFPVGKQTATRVLKGNKVPLSDGAVVSDGVGCEWLVAVFSDKPISLATVEAAVKNGRTDSTPGVCGLDVEVQGARTVQVLPVTR